jgi:thiopurine S-methyltransferase
MSTHTPRPPHTSPTTPDQPEFWKERWDQRDIGFDQTRPNAFLIHHFSNCVPSPQKVFVPLCGKSIDMQWLLEQGHEVIGVELSPVACSNFFQQNGIEFTQSTEDGFSVYSSQKCTIYCGDFFHLSTSQLKGATVAYDRAALIALPLETRRKYFDKLVSLLASPSAIFLITCEYPQAEATPPPHSVDERELAALADAGFQVNVIETQKAEPSALKNPKFQKVTAYTEKAYWLESKVQTQPTRI